MNITKARVDVWRSPAIDGAFALLPDPFPGHAVTIHPRLRVELLSGDLYVMARDPAGVLLLNRWTNGAWQQPLVAATGAAGYPNITFPDRFLRTGPQFSFDVGAAAMPDGRDAVRVLYTAPDLGRVRVKGSTCIAGWTRDPPAACPGLWTRGRPRTAESAPPGGPGCRWPGRWRWPRAQGSPAGPGCRRPGQPGSRPGRRAGEGALPPLRRATYAAPTQAILDRAMQIDRQFGDLTLGLVDASIAALAEELGLYRIATRDVRHFGAIRLRGGHRFELVVQPRRPERR